MALIPRAFSTLISQKMITIIAGTNRQGSNTLKLANYCKVQIQKKGVAVDIISLTELPDNFIASDMYGKRSEAFQQIQDRITASDKFLFVIPEYNGGYPGILKTFIDACTFPNSFSGKKAALIGLSAGKYGNIRGLEHFTGIAHYFNLHILPLKLHIPMINAELDEHGNLIKENTLSFIDQQLEQLIAF